jgi:hypothetical protein
MGLSVKKGLGLALGIVYVLIGVLGYNYFGIESPYREIFSIALVTYGAWRFYRAIISE